MDWFSTKISLLTELCFTTGTVSLTSIYLSVIVIFRLNVAHAGRHNQVPGGAAHLLVAGVCDFGRLLAGASL
jgi:hypothetical protein